jgi:ABC-2 type transport system ATP-binding protein
MVEALLLDQVYKKIGNRKILEDVTLAVQPGDIFGYLGPNGAGKTTTIRIIMGLFREDSGTVDVLGENTSQDSLRRKIGFVLEYDGLYDNLTARENLEFYYQLYGIHEARGNKIDEMLHLVGLYNRAGDKVATYSKGMRQKLALARAMVHDPELLILDEPTAGIDPSGQMEMRDIIINLSHNQGKTIFLSSHNLDEVQRICNRIALIDKGRIKIYGELEQLKKAASQQELIIETSVKETDALQKVMDELKNLAYIAGYHLETGRIYITLKGKEEVSEIVAVLAQKGVPIEGVKKSEATLEEIYSKAVRDVENERNIGDFKKGFKRNFTY